MLSKILCYLIFLVCTLFIVDNAFSAKKIEKKEHKTNKKNTPKKKNKAKSKKKKKNTKKYGFIEYCKDTKAPRRMRQVVLDIVHKFAEKDCKKAYLKLKAAKELDLSDFGLTDLNILKKASKLQFLYLAKNNISNIKALSKLKQLQILNLQDNEIEDLSPLKNLRGIRDLNLSRNKIKDIGALSKFRNLRYLDLSHNQLTNVSALKDLKNLRRLNLADNKITSIRVLMKHKYMEKLFLNQNKIHSVAPLINLNYLGVLVLDNNPIRKRRRSCPYGKQFPQLLSSICYSYLHPTPIAKKKPAPEENNQNVDVEMLKKLLQKSNQQNNAAPAQIKLPPGFKLPVKDPKQQKGNLLDTSRSKGLLPTK